MSDSATQFAWRVLGNAPYPPPEPKRGPRYGPDERCCLCGAATGGAGWHRSALPPTYTNWNLCAVPASQTICQPCMALAGSDTWRDYVAAHPEAGLKAGLPLSWRTYSHAFTVTGHECPNRKRWRELLLHPPEPPFLFVITESGQKHLIFRAQVAYSRDVYPVQVEEDLLLVNREAFAACLVAFERLYALGFSKDSIRDQRYHPAQLLKVGPVVWGNAEEAFAAFRKRHTGLVRLAHFCAQKPEESA